MPDKEIPLEDACARVGGLYKVEEGKDPYCDVSHIERSSDRAITMRVKPVVQRAESPAPPLEVNNDGPPTEPQDGV